MNLLFCLPKEILDVIIDYLDQSSGRLIDISQIGL